MEPHHLIPIAQNLYVYDKYRINIDCVENIVSLCLTCHRAIHYGLDEVRINLIQIIFEICKSKYESVGLNISFNELLKLNNIKK